MKFLFHILVLVLISCSNEESVPLEKFELPTEISIEEPDSSTEIDNTIYFYEVDSFGIDDFLGFDLTEVEIASNFSNYHWTKTPIINKYNNEIIDTNITITNENDTIIFYRYEDKFMIEWATIHGSEIHIYSCIHVGQSKADLKLIFSEIDTTHSTIQIGMSGPFTCTLYFDQNKISYVDYSGYVD